MYQKFIFLCLLAVSWSSEVQKENNVLVLNKDNFHEVVKDKKVLVEFYAPWCGHCKALEPEYAKAATTLNEEKSDLFLAKVDATVETELAEKYQVKGYPTLKFFIDGKIIEYTGDRQAEGIIKWLNKKTGPPANDLSTVDAAKAFIDANEIAIVGFFKDQESADAKVFKSVALEMDDFVFGITSNDEVYKNLEASKDGVILFKKFDEKKDVYEGSITEEDIKKFIAVNSLPLVVEFTSNSARRIFGGDVKTHTLLFMSKKSSDYEKTVETFRSVAKEYKSKVLFVTIDPDVEDHENILSFFGMKEDSLPTVRIIKLEDEITKYSPPTGTKLDLDGIKGFVSGVLDGKIGPHLLSEEIPQDWDKHPVKVLVAKNFDEVAFDKSKNVLVEFYAPWCAHCKRLAPIYDELGEKYKESSDVVIAKMDATANELPHTKIENYPTIKLFRKDTNEAITYNGERTLEGIMQFIETGGDYGRAAPDEEEDEEEEKDDEPKRDEL